VVQGIRVTAKQGTITLLLVDDYDPWRATLRKLLARPGWEVVGEASDGPGAVLKANQLQPDIVILDVGLPGFDGIQAARLIRQQSPQSNIIFFSQQAEDEIREAALEAGGVAYVLKSNVSTDLLTAIAATQAAASEGQPVSISSRT
jgi:DNA-binding NarL/FixJ family response regulator